MLISHCEDWERDYEYRHLEYTECTVYVSCDDDGGGDDCSGSFNYNLLNTCYVPLSAVSEKQW